MDSKPRTGAGSGPLNSVMGMSRACGSGEVEGVVEFREEDVVLVRSFEDEAAGTDNWSDCFPGGGFGEMGEDLGFRDVVVEMEGAVESCEREVVLGSVALEEVARLVGSAVNRVLGRGGDLEAAFVKGLDTFLTSRVSALVSTGIMSAQGLSVSKLNIPCSFGALPVVTMPGGFRGGGENTFGLDGTIFLEEGVVDRVDADLLNAGGDLTLGLRMTPEMVRLRTGVGTGDSLGLAEDAEMGDFVGRGGEGGSRRCAVEVFAFWSCCTGGFRKVCLDETSEVGVRDFALA